MMLGFVWMFVYWVVVLVVFDVFCKGICFV